MTNDAAQYGAAHYDVEHCGAARYGVVRCGELRCDVAKRCSRNGAHVGLFVVRAAQGGAHGARDEDAQRPPMSILAPRAASHALEYSMKRSKQNLTMP